MSSNIKTGYPPAKLAVTSSISTGTLETERETNGALDIPTKVSSNMIKISEPLTKSIGQYGKSKWNGHCLCSLEGYADGSIQCPEDPLKARYWTFNNSWAQFIIVNNIPSSEMVNTTQCSTMLKMWLSVTIGVGACLDQLLTGYDYGTRCVMLH